MAEPADSSGDNTQPTEDIINTLNGIKNESQPDIDMLPPPTEYEALLAQLKQRPHDPNGWKKLIDLAEESGDMDKVRASFDALLQQYPNTVCDLKVHFSRV